MRINIVFPYNTWSGAHRSTYELANRMAARGHSVHVYFPIFPFLDGLGLLSRKGIGRLTRGLGRSLLRWNRIPWFDVQVPVKMVPRIADRFIRDADVVMANHWQTQEPVWRLSRSKGRKFNFVRDSEIDSVSGRVMDAYRLDLAKIVTLPWIKDYLEREAGVEVRGVVPNGINMDQFGVGEKVHNNPPVVTMVYNPGDPRKGVDDGLRALALVARRHPEVKIQMFGWKPRPDLPFLAAYHHRPVKETLRGVYAGTDIFLASSRAEGYHNPPREAMAAQCAVVATNVGSIPYCAVPGETAIVVEPGDVDGMAAGIFHLIENPEEMRALGARAHEHIKQFDWEESTTALIEIFAT